MAKLRQEKLRTLMLTQWYVPEPGPAVIPSVIARGLRQRSHDVTVLTGFPNYPDGKVQRGWKQSWLFCEIRDGIKVFRVPLYPSHDGRVLARLLNYSSFGITAAIGYMHARYLSRRDREGIEKPDVQWVSYSPITVGIAQLIGRLFDGTPTIIWVGDLWPDTLLAADVIPGKPVSGDADTHSSKRYREMPSSVIGRGIWWAASIWCSMLYRCADAIIVISPSVKDVLVDRGVPPEKIHYVPVSPDASVFHAISEDEAQMARERFGIHEGVRTLLYAGSMGKAQELETLIKASAMVESNLGVLIAGSGVEEQRLRKLSDELDAPVTFLGRIPQSDMTYLLGAVDAGFVGLKDAPESYYTMPSKTQGLLAARKPIICCAPGDVARLVDECEVGLSCAPGNPAVLAKTLDHFVAVPDDQLEQWGLNAEATYMAEFAEDAVARATDQVLRDVVRGGPVLADVAEGIEAIAGVALRDAQSLAVLHQRAFPSFFLSQLGIQFLTRFYRGFAFDPSALAVVFRRDGKVIGSCVGSSDPKGFYSRLLKRDFIGFALAGAGAALKNPKAIPRIMRGMFYRGGEAGDSGADGLLASICVDPKEAGKGIGTALFKNFMAIAEARGVKKIGLVTDATGNDRVNRFYQSNGAVLEGSYQTPQGRQMNRYVVALNKVVSHA